MPKKKCTCCQLTFTSNSKRLVNIKYSLHQKSESHVRQKALNVAKTLEKNYRFKLGRDRLYDRETKTITLPNVIINYPVRLLKDAIRQEIDLLIK